MNTKIFCDIADLKTIKIFNKKKIVKGFTTNPSLIIDVIERELKTTMPELNISQRRRHPRFLKTRGVGGVKRFVDEHFHHFNAGALKDTADSLQDFLAKDGKLMITLAGAMSTAELGRSLAPLIKSGKVHAITCTGANLEEDIFNLVAHNSYQRVRNWRSLSLDEEQELHERGNCEGQRGENNGKKQTFAEIFRAQCSFIPQDQKKGCANRQCLSNSQHPRPAGPDYHGLIVDILL